jgi:DNA-binding MarR family transcriptional regulator
MNTRERSGLMAAGEPIAGADGEITLGLLTALHADGKRSQRSLASELGIALGLTNAYIKRCIRKGLIKVSQVPANRYAYYLTPKGFAEKSRLTAEYLSDSLRFYRRARGEFETMFAGFTARGIRTIALVGSGDLAEIALLCANAQKMTVVAVIDDRQGGQLLGVPIAADLEASAAGDLLVVTDLRSPQRTYDACVARYGVERVAAPSLLKVAGKP